MVCCCEEEKRIEENKRNDGRENVREVTFTTEYLVLVRVCLLLNFHLYHLLHFIITLVLHLEIF
jgi:hypothetical protein